MRIIHIPLALSIVVTMGIEVSMGQMVTATRLNGGNPAVPRGRQPKPVADCPKTTEIEFISPMPTEEIPHFHMPGAESWHVILEIALPEPLQHSTGIFEGFFMPSPGLTAALPTDVNGDTVIGDPHPAIPGLSLVADDDLLVNGFLLPAGTNLASFIEMIGSEIEHGGDQSTSLTWIVDPQFMFIDNNMDLGTTLITTFNNVGDFVFVLHGNDYVYSPCSAGMPSTPTVSIFTSDWISTVDSDVAGKMMTPFLVGVEVRIPCWFDPMTVPPTPKPLDPIPGMPPAPQMMTGNFPLIPGPGNHPAYPSLYVTFSDDYFDVATGSFVPGGIVGGGTCATIYGTTGPNLGFAFEQASVSAWYGVNGVPNLMPVLSDDQLIYRFTMIADGIIMDTDVLPGEMLISASIETECNLFSITNVRVKHRPDVLTPDPSAP